MITSNILSLQIGKPTSLEYKGNDYFSGVAKGHVSEAFLTKEGFQGDEVANTKNHGGPDRAVLMYSHDHYAKWNEEFRTQFNVPGFGENVTPVGMTEADVFIGDVYEMGDAVIQVTQSRIPCFTLSKYNGIDAVLSRMVESGYTGYLCRVIQEGMVSQNSNLTLVDRDAKSVSVLFTNQIYFHDKDNQEAIQTILAIDSLAKDWREKLEQRLKSI